MDSIELFGGGVVGILILALIAIVSLVIYFLPTVIAFMRHNGSKVAILLINLFLGWSGIAWFVTLIWAFVGKKN